MLKISIIIKIFNFQLLIDTVKINTIKFIYIYIN